MQLIPKNVFSCLLIYTFCLENNLPILYFKLLWHHYIEGKYAHRAPKADQNILLGGLSGNSLNKRKDYLNPLFLKTLS